MAIPEMNFKTISEGIMNLPSAPDACAMNEFVSWIDAKGMNRSVVEVKTGDQGTEYKTDFSPKTIAIALGRTAATAFILPVIATLGAMYNAAVGVTKIGLGVVTHMKIDPNGKREEVEEMRAEARAAMLEGIEHILTAVYDFAVGIFSTVIALAYGASPQLVQKGHDMAYRGYDEVVAPAAPAKKGKKQDAEEHKENVHVESFIAQGAAKITDGMFPQQHQADLPWYKRMFA